MARIKESVVTDFLKLQKDLTKIIDAYGMTQKHVYSKIGMTKPRWHRKIKDAKFTGNEMLDIVKVINR